PGGDHFVGSHGRLFDVIVLGRPGHNPNGSRMGTLEAALFESGQPVLIAPPSPRPQMGTNALVSWIFGRMSESSKRRARNFRERASSDFRAPPAPSSVAIWTRLRSMQSGSIGRSSLNSRGRWFVALSRPALLLSRCRFSSGPPASLY